MHVKDAELDTKTRAQDTKDWVHDWCTTGVQGLL